jgi:hypothetical protein
LFGSEALVEHAAKALVLDKTARRRGGLPGQQPMLDVVLTTAGLPGDAVIRPSQGEICWMDVSAYLCRFTRRSAATRIIPSTYLNRRSAR